MSAVEDARRGLELRRLMVLAGPNIWANFPVIEAWVDLGRWVDTSSADVPGFNDRLMSALPTMVEHRCSVGTRGGFFERLRRGTYPAHILEHVTLELQSLAGAPVGFGKARGMIEETLYRVVFRYQDESLARACLDAASRLVSAWLEGRPFDLAETLTGLRALAARVLPDRGTAAILEAAREQGVPVFRLGEGSGLFQLGQGVRRRRIWDAVTDQTGAVGQEVASDGPLSREILGPLGVPLPEGRLVENAEDAWGLAEELGPPVVVRPSRRVFGPGVTVGPTTREQVVAAFEAARAESAHVALEKWAEGAVHHLLVVGDRVVGAVRRGSEPENPESEKLKDVTEPPHPEVSARAIEAARGVGLEIAGIDLLASSLARPLEEQGGAVLRVRPRPDLGLYLDPNLSAPRPLGAAIVERLFPGGQSGRIPVVGVTGGPERRETARLLAAILQASGRRVGLGGSDGVEVEGRRLARAPIRSWKAARSVLVHPEVEAAVLEASRGEILSEGLGFDLCDVGIVIGLDESISARDWGFEDPEDILRAERCVIDVVPAAGWAVLDADDPRVASMAEHRAGGLILVSGADRTPPGLEEWRGRGGRVVFRRGESIARAEGDWEAELPGLAGPSSWPIRAILAAVAAAWALEIDDRVVHSAIASAVAGAR